MSKRVDISRIFNEAGVVICVPVHMPEGSIGLEKIANAWDTGETVYVRNMMPRTGLPQYAVSVGGTVLAIVASDHIAYWTEEGIPFTLLEE